MEKVTLVKKSRNISELSGEIVDLIIEGVDLKTGQVVLFTQIAGTPMTTHIVNGKIVDGKLVKE